MHERVHNNSMLHAQGVSIIKFASPAIPDPLHHRVKKHFGSLESTQEARVALGCVSNIS